MKKLTLEDLPWKDAGTTVDLTDLQERSPLLKHIDEMQKELSKYHQGSLGIQPTVFSVPIRGDELHEFLNAVPELQPIERVSMAPDVEASMKAALRRSKLSTQISEIDYEVLEKIIFAKVFDLKDILPNFSRQTTLVMSSKQQADTFYERYIKPINKPKVKPSPLNQAIQNHLNKESDND